MDPSHEDISNTNKVMLQQFNKEDVNKKVTDGKLERAKTKEEKEQEAVI